MLSCTNCGRRNVASDRHCTGCGVSLPSGERVPGRVSMRVTLPVKPAIPRARSRRSSPCPHCTRPVDQDLAFCRHCGLPVASPPSPSKGQHPCHDCGALGNEVGACYCRECGATLASGADVAGVTAPRGLPAIGGRARLSLLDSTGDITKVIPLDQFPTIVGRVAGELAAGSEIAEQIELFPAHDRVRIRPLTSASSIYLFVSEPHPLADGDIVLIGSQVIRFRLLPPCCFPAESDALMGRGSRVPGEDMAVLEQMMAGGIVRDVHHLTVGRSLMIGREHGDWVFPYDATMSARHAEIKPRGDGTASFVVRDLGSRNGVAIAMRGALDVMSGSRLMLGNQMMRVELA